MSNDFDQAMIQNDLYNPNSPFYLNKPTVMEIVDNPMKYYVQPATPNTNYLGNNIPDITRTQKHDTFSTLENDLKKRRKSEGLKTALAGIAIALGVGFLSGKLTKFPKINFKGFSQKFANWGQSLKKGFTNLFSKSKNLTANLLKKKA